MTRRRYVLTREARFDLRDILEGIAEDSPETAERLLAGIRDEFQRLGLSPGIGHFHDELASRRYRFWNFHSYVVCYEWQRRPIRIICVVHGARHLKAYFDLRAP